MWRLRDKFQILPSYPAPIRQMFPQLPENIEKVDAAYERPDGNIVLFTGLFISQNFCTTFNKQVIVFGSTMELILSKTAQDL